MYSTDSQTKANFEFDAAADTANFTDSIQSQNGLLELCGLGSGPN